jgi:hypothetical protein
MRRFDVLLLTALLGTAAPAHAQRPAEKAPPKKSPPVFVGAVHKMLLSACRWCHSAGGAAAATRLVLKGDPRADYAATQSVIDPGEPRASALVARAAGEVHGGGVVFAGSSPQYQELVAWIAAGARFQVEKPRPRKRRSR